MGNMGTPWFTIDEVIHIVDEITYNLNNGYDQFFVHLKVLVVALYLNSDTHLLKAQNLEHLLSKYN